MTPINESREAGFSLIESAIVFLIIAIVVAMAIPPVSKSMNGYNLRSAADHIAGRLAAGRALAMEKNQIVAVVFQRTGQYGFDFDEDGVIDVTDPDHPSIGYPLSTLPGGINFTPSIFPPGADVIIRFNSRGELPIGTTIPAGQPGLIVRIENSAGALTIVTNLRGKVWVE